MSCSSINNLWFSKVYHRALRMPGLLIQDLLRREKILEKIIDTIIVPMALVLLVFAVNVQYELVDYTSVDVTYTEENEENFDANSGETPIKLYWMNGTTSLYLQAVQQPEDNYVVIFANLQHPFGINTAATFVKRPVPKPFQYTLINYAILGSLTVDPTSGVNGTYNVTIFENQNQTQHPVSVFKDDDGHRIQIISGPPLPGSSYPMYLTVTSSYTVVAVNATVAISSKPKEFYTPSASFIKHCQP